MARRSNSGSPKIALWGAIVLIVAVVVGVWVMGGAVGSKGYRTVPPLDLGAYMENSNSLRGNVYQVEGEVLHLLAWSPSAGRLVSIGVSERVLPVLVTPTFNHINIQRGQRFSFLVEVDENGVLRTRELRKA